MDILLISANREMSPIRFPHRPRISCRAADRTAIG
jgi:hypothetical protein